MQRLHANVIKIGSFGLLVSGDSGAGKSAISLALLDRATWFSRPAKLVADDYCEIDVKNGKLVARAPETLKGAMEIRGAGVFAFDYEDEVVLTHAVHLSDTAERFPSGHQFEFSGVKLPMLYLPGVNKVEALMICQAIEAYLFRPIWDNAAAKELKNR